VQDHGDEESAKCRGGAAVRIESTVETILATS